MPRSALYEAFEARGIRMGEYGGVESAAAFGDVAAELEILRSGCAVYDLGWRAKLIAAGPDRARWMNGMVTNNIKDLPLNRGSYNFLLNAQGRIQGDLYVYNRGEYLLIDTDGSQRDKIKGIFEKFIIMDDVEISGASDKIVAVGLEGPAAAEVLKRSGFVVDKLEKLEVRDLTWNGIGLSLVRQASPSTGYELWMAPQNASAVWEHLTEHGAKPVGTDALELFRISRGIPRYGQDIRERDLPQETAQDQALDFQKGCYVGQEIVERIHSRGNVHRCFTGFRFTEATPAPGTKIQTAEKEVGEVTSVAALPSKNGQPHMIGLGYLRREAAGSDVELHAGQARVKPVALPFKDL
jgi:folate-binding protein YgfZ